MRRVCFAIVCVLVGVQIVCAPAVSAEDSGQRTYEENIQRWHQMSPEEREMIREKVRGLTPEQREALQDRAREFRRLPKEDRARIRSNFKKFRGMPPEKRQEMRSRHHRFREMPEEKRREMRQRFRNKRADDIRGRTRGERPLRVRTVEGGTPTEKRTILRDGPMAMRNDQRHNRTIDTHDFFERRTHRESRGGRPERRDSSRGRK